MKKEKKLLIWKSCVFIWLVIMGLSVFFPVVKVSRFSKLAEDKSAQIGSELLFMHKKYLNSCQNESFAEKSIRNAFNKELLSLNKAMYYDLWSGKNTFINSEESTELILVESENQIKFSDEMNLLVSTDVTTLPCVKNIAELNNKIVDNVKLYNYYISQINSEYVGVYKYILKYFLDVEKIKSLPTLYVIDISLDSGIYKIKRSNQ